MDYEKLVNDLIEARKVAIAEGTRNKDDGGTCNFDTPIIHLPRVRKEKIKEIAEKAGVELYKWDSGTYHICGDFLWGQAYLRTRMAEAFEKSLADKGYDTYVYYAMD